MKRIVSLFFACCTLLSQAILGQDCCYSSGTTDCFGFDTVLTFDIGGGYRQDDIEWKTSSLSDPDLIQKVEWNKLEMGIVETNAQFLACEHYLAKLDFDYGWFDDGGKQHIRRFALQEGNCLLSKHLRSDTNGHVYNLDGAIGYQFNWCCYRYALTPLVGYSYHYQKLKNHNFRDCLSDNKFAIHNRYILRWRGPTLGIAAAYQISCDWQVSLLYTYHWVRYRAKVNENFSGHKDNENFTRHRHIVGDQKANKVHGNEFKISTSYQFCPDWILNLNVDYKIFQGNSGRFEAKRRSRCEHDAKLHDLKWTSLNATATVGYIF